MTNTPDKTLQLAAMCPCGKTEQSNLVRIPRPRLIKALLFWLPLKHYKCHKCQRHKLILQ